MERKKIKIMDFDGRKLDSVVVTSEKDFKERVKMWKLKGWL